MTIIGTVLAAGIAAAAGFGPAATAQAAPTAHAAGANSEIFARSSCPIKEHTFSINEHETPPTPTADTRQTSTSTHRAAAR